MFTGSRQPPGSGWSPPPPPRAPLDPAQMDRETLDDEYCLGQERYASLYGAYQELAVLMDALTSENARLRAEVGAGHLVDATPDLSVEVRTADRVAELEAELAARESTILSLQQRSLELLAEQDGKEEEAQQLREAVRSLERHVERLQQDLKEGDGMVARLETAVRALRRESEARGETLRAAEQEVAALQKANDRLEARVLASVRPSPPRMMTPPAAAAAPVVTPEASSSPTAAARAEALEEENADLRRRLAAVKVAHGKMREAGNQMLAKMEAAQSQARVWEREAKLWREEAGQWHARAAAAAGTEEDAGLGELARIKAELEELQRGKQRLRVVYAEYERAGLDIRRYQRRC